MTLTALRGGQKPIAPEGASSPWGERGQREGGRGRRGGNETGRSGQWLPACGTPGSQPAIAPGSGGVGVGGSPVKTGAHQTPHLP